MVVGGSRQETLDPGFVLLGTRQQVIPVILRELVLPDGFDPVSTNFMVRNVTTELSRSTHDIDQSTVKHNIDFYKQKGDIFVVLKIE
ncbi:unnamed protein product [Schistosoma mattheei]|uniref:Uncharacterized protein n=1 Tax=Schistosoma mattheei TaxID=31246 RepID=A0A183PLM1_9TREM|nr:unnamed protein product [Schistosoma mattheei]